MPSQLSSRNEVSNYDSGEATGAKFGIQGSSLCLVREDTEFPLVHVPLPRRYASANGGNRSCQPTSRGSVGGMTSGANYIDGQIGSHGLMCLAQGFVREVAHVAPVVILIEGFVPPEVALF